jgi:hypothetical protein
VDPASVLIPGERQTVYQGDQAAHNAHHRCSRSRDKNEYRFLAGRSDVRLDQTMTVQVNATDLDGNASATPIRT